MRSLFHTTLLLLSLLLALNGIAQAQAAVRMAWVELPVVSDHQHLQDVHAAMSCCDESQQDHHSKSKASSCSSSHLCCTLAGLLNNATPVIVAGMEATPRISSSPQPLPLTILSFWRPPRA